MHFSTFVAAQGFAAGLSAASPLALGASISDYIRSASTTPANNVTSTTAEPCAQVSSALAASDLLHPHIDAEVALQCLRSVPLDLDGDTSQLEGVKAMAQFQSTLAYLKDPPPGYLYPAVDILGGLDELANRLQSNYYANEYDFQNDLSLLISSAYDGHFNYNPDITQIFAFARAEYLLSVSEDGTKLPEVYLGGDAAALIHPNASEYTPSPVGSINGVDVESYLNSLATAEGGNQDPDANYNTVFYNVPETSSGTPTQGVFSIGNQYAGTTTEIVFRNGTTNSIKTFAVTAESFEGVDSGAAFFKKFCTGAQQQPPTPSSAPSNSTPTVLTTQVSYSAVPTQTAIPAPTAYPAPLVIADDLSIAGYFPEENTDLAVLSIPTFAPTGGTVQFEDVVRELLASAKAAGKTRLIIDLRGNGGGTVLLAYDLFKQLFPSIQPYGATNFRAFPLFDIMGQTISHFNSNVSAANATNADSSNGFSSIWNFESELTQLDTDYSSWQEFYGPLSVHGGNFTNLARYNLSDPYDTSNISVSGYGSLANVVPQQTLAAEDIIMLQDGACASTCAVFAEFMKTQGGVQQVVVGGRKQYGPMQGVGGVKGANVYGLDLIGETARVALSEGTPAQQAQWSVEYGAAFTGGKQAILRAVAGPDGPDARVNIRNNIREGDESLTPLQFVYEAADCRLFYTAPMYAKQSLVWSAAYNAHWGNGTCVPGSTGQPSSLSGSSYNETASPPTGANNTFGATGGLVPYSNVTSTSTGTASATSTVPVISSLAAATIVTTSAAVSTQSTSTAAVSFSAAGVPVGSSTTSATVSQFTGAATGRPIAGGLALIAAGAVMLL